MANEEQLDVREAGSGIFVLEFPYDDEFIQTLKANVPARDRSYDEDTHLWTVCGEQYIPRIIASGQRRFRHVTRIFHRKNELVIVNTRTGAETVQLGLFA